MGKTKRIFYYDVLRAIAIIGIVFCHAAGYFVLTGMGKPNFFIAAFFDCFRDFSIPIFVMLSGALLLKRKDSLIDFFKKRLSRLLIPFIFWVFISFIYSSIYIKHAFDISHFIDILFAAPGTVGVAYWFIWMIIVVYVGIFIINRTIEFGNLKIENFDKKFITALTALSVIFILCSQLGVFSSFNSKLFYFVSFLSYIVIGFFIANNDYVGSKISIDKMIIITFLVSLGLYSYYIFGFVVPKSISANHFVYKGYFNLLILTLSVNIFVLFKYLSKTKFFINMEEKNFGKALITISKYSFGIYLCHYIVLNRLKVCLLKYFYNQNPLVWIPILVILTVSISLLILIILNRIPYLNKFSGKS